MLDLKVQSFLTVCETLNYSRAAEILHLSQPAITKHIQSLETYYQTVLFEYKNRSLTLTEDGKLLRRLMTTMQQDIRRAQQEFSHSGPRTRIRLRVGATQSIGNFLLAKQLPDILRTYPELDISLTVADTQALLVALDQNKLDFIFCEGNFPKNAYEFRLIGEVPLALFYGADYDIGKVEQIGDLLKHTLIIREKGSGTREILETFLKSGGYTIGDFKNYHEVNNSEGIIELLSQGVGISILYETIGKEAMATGRIKKHLLTHALVHEFNLIWNKSDLPPEALFPYAEALMDAVKKTLSKSKKEKTIYE